MTLSLTELEAITKDYFMLDNGKAADIYFTDSFILNRLLKQKKGLYKTISGGIYITVPLKYDGAEGGFYSSGATLSSDKRTTRNAARFTLKHLYSNATIIRIDELQCSGPEAVIDYASDELETAQKQITKDAATSVYSAAGSSADEFDGFRLMCSETTTTKYGDIAEDDLAAEDGTKPWEGKTDSSTTAITLDIFRNARRLAKINDGPKGRPNLAVSTETIWQEIETILQAQQQFTNSSAAVDAGFTGLKYQGVDFIPDDFCPSGYAFFLNTDHVGFGVHKEGNFYRMPWMIIPDSGGDRTMKILFDGNIICNNRKAHYCFSALA